MSTLRQSPAQPWNDCTVQTPCGETLPTEPVGPDSTLIRKPRRKDHHASPNLGPSWQLAFGLVQPAPLHPSEYEQIPASGKC
jgi:hypothetical protein